MDEIERTQVEDTAKRLGWAPKDKYRGPAEKWRDAPEYIEFVNKEFPVLRERVQMLARRNGDLETTNRQLSGQIGELNQTIDDFRIFNDKREERAYQRARKAIEAEMDAAVAASDPSQYRAAKQRLNDLDEEAREQAEDQRKTVEDRRRRAPNGRETQPVHPDVQQWLADNEWFNTDPVLNTTAVAIHGTLKRDQPGLSLAQNLAEVTRQVKEAFPKKFGITARREPEDDNARVNPPSGNEDERPAPRRRAAGGKKGYEDLPSDAKRECDRFLKNKMIKNKEEYCETYFENEESE